MKQKIKRHYRSAVSILLSVCMLISCMTVGLIATDAARVSKDDEVRSDFIAYCMIGDQMGWSGRSDDYHNMGSTVTYDCSAYIGQDMYFRVVCDGTDYGVQDSPSVTIGQWYALVNDTSKTAKRTVTKGLLTFKATNEGGKGQVYVTSDSEPEYKLYNGSTSIATFSHPSSSKTFTATTETLTAGTTYNLSVKNSYTNYKSSSSGTLTTSSSVTLEKDKSNTISFTPTVTAPYIFTWQMNSNRGTYSGTLSVEPSTATVTPAANPAGGGTAEISSTENGTYSTSPLENITPNSTVYVKATANQYYEFSEWEAVSGLTFTDRTQSTAQAVAVSGSATAKAKFVKTKYNVTAGTFEHGTISVPSSSVAWGTTVTPTVTPERGYKVNKLYTSTDDGTTWTEEASSTSFEMPKSNVMVKAEMVAATEYTVNFSGVNGTVTAMESDGTPVTSGGKVYEGTEVTFTATPNIGYLFTGWSGLDGNTSIASKTITEDTTVTATFVKEGYHLINTDNTTAKMIDLSNGLYITSSKLADNAYFKIKRDADNKQSQGNNSSASQHLNSNQKYDVSNWESFSSTWNNNYSFKNTTGGKAYVVYDSINDRVYLTTDSKGYYDVKVYLKRGTVRYDTKNSKYFDTSALFGEFTVVKDGSSSGSSISTSDTSGYSYIKEFTVSAAAIRAAADAGNSKKVYIKAQTTNEYKDNYFVQGFDVNGGLTRSVISQFDGNGIAINTDKILSSGNSWNEFVLDVGGYADNEIVVTLIYGPKVASSSDVVRFYAYDFAGEVKDKWGGYLAVYPYITDEYDPFKTYPGQLMINEGGTYYTELPTKNATTGNLIQGITLNNYTWVLEIIIKILQEECSITVKPMIMMSLRSSITFSRRRKSPESITAKVLSIRLSTKRIPHPIPQTILLRAQPTQPVTSDRRRTLIMTRMRFRRSKQVSMATATAATDLSQWIKSMTRQNSNGRI